MHVTDGDRTFTKDKDSFGTVSRTTLFGCVKTKSSVLEMDDGTYTLYVGENLKEQVVNKTTGKDGKGVSIELPTDVKKEGPTILGSLGIPQANIVALFEKFMVLDKATRRQKMNEWENTTDENRDIFLSEFLSLLEDDHLYVKTYADILLNHLDDDLRQKMKVDFFNMTTSEERVALINQFASVKRNKKKTEIFLQGLYEMLLDDDTYWAMQLKLYGREVYKEPTLSNKIVGYMANEKESRKNYFIVQWRKRRIYNNKRAYKRWIKSFLKKY